MSIEVKGWSELPASSAKTIVGLSRTVHSVTDSAELNTALAAATSGDLIKLGTATYAMGDIVLPSGVSLQGNGSANSIITGAVICNNEVNESNEVFISGMTINSTDVASNGFGQNELRNGRFRLDDVVIYSNRPTGGGNCLTFVANLSLCIAYCNNVTVHGAERDGISTKVLTAEFAKSSYVTVDNSYIYNNGLLSTDQGLTTHGGFGATVQNSKVYAQILGDSSHVAIAQDSSSSPIKVINCDVVGKVSANHVTGCILRGDGLPRGERFVFLYGDDDGLVLNNTFDGVSSSEAYQGVCVTMSGSANVCICGNSFRNFLYDGSNEACIKLTHNGSGKALIQNNRFLGFLRGIDNRYAEGAGSIILCGNEFRGATNYNILTDAASNALVTSSYNRFEENKFTGGFTPDATDILEYA